MVIPKLLRGIICFFFILTVCSVKSQTSWTLQKCVSEAVKNNLQILQSDLNIKQSQINHKQLQAERFPDLNASTGIGENFGRRVDPTTNSFNSQNFTNQSYSLNSGITIFNFNRISNSIKKAKEDLKVSEAEKAQLILDISLNTAQAYLQVILAKEMINTAYKNKEQTDNQLSLTDKLITAGSKSKNSKLEILATQALNQSQIIESQNNYSSALLNLKQMIQIDPNLDFEIVVPIINLPTQAPELIDYEALVQRAYITQPIFESLNSQMNSALINQKIAKTQRLPSISASANLNSYYSSLNQRITGYTQIEINQNIKINDAEVTLTTNSFEPNFSKNPYFNQLNENIGYSVGLGLNIPIYNNYRIKASEQQAYLNTESIAIKTAQQKQMIRSDILKAMNDAQSYKKSYESSILVVEAKEASLTDTKQRFEIGSANTFELLNMKATYENVITDSLIKKYNYIFAMKVLDFYAGKLIQLEN